MSVDLESYPGNTVPARTEDFDDLKERVANLGLALTLQAGRTCFDPVRGLINIDTRSRNTIGFVPVSALADEYLHAWNQVHGRGRWLRGLAQTQHRSMGVKAQQYGTSALARSENKAFHKLEALNFIESGEHIPQFLWRIPYSDLRLFANSWPMHS